MTRLGLVVVGICCRSPPGLKPHARRGERRGHRVRGLWCFERLIRVGHRDRLAERRIPSSAPGRPPCGHSKNGCPPQPGSCPADGLCSARVDLCIRQCEACGTALGRSAWVRFSVRPRGLIRPRSWVRALVCSARRAAQFYGSKVTQARDLTSKLDDDDRAKYGRGFTVLRAFARARPVRRRSGPHRLHSDGLRPRAWSTPTATSPARNGNPMEPLVAGPPLSASRRSRDRRLRARRSGRSRRTAPCRPTVPSPMAQRAAARHRWSRLGGGLKKLEDGH